MARVPTVTQREGQSTVYALQYGVRRFLGADARSGTRLTSASTQGGT